VKLPKASSHKNPIRVNGLPCNAPIGVERDTPRSEQKSKYESLDFRARLPCRTECFARGGTPCPLTGNPVKPRIVVRLLSHLGVEPRVALGPPVPLLVLWAAAALFFAAGINGYLKVRRRAADPALARFHAYLAGFRGCWHWVGQLPTFRMPCRRWAGWEDISPQV